MLAGADSVLLDTYEAERLPTAAGVLDLATRKYDAIAKLRPSSITRGSDESQLTVSYRGGPLASDDSARPDGCLGQIASENMTASTRAAIRAMTPNARTSVSDSTPPRMRNARRHVLTSAP